MPAFPDIGWPLAAGLQESLPNNLTRTPMETGPAKVRRRTTSSPYQISIPYVLTGEDTATLDAFYLTTLMSGALSFTMLHPRTGQQITCRFLSQPQYAWDDGYYRTVLSLEVLP